MALTGVRYIRNSLEGNTYNDYCHWLEVKAMAAGDNVALGKTVTSSKPGRSPYNNPAVVTDGKLITGIVPDYFDLDLGTAYIVVDLEQTYDLDSIIIWHYYPAPTDRMYHGNVVEISADGENWITIFDSNIDGEYIETVDGLVLTDMPAKTEQEILDKIDELMVKVGTVDTVVDDIIVSLNAMVTRVGQLKTSAGVPNTDIAAAVDAYSSYVTARDLKKDDIISKVDTIVANTNAIDSNADFTAILASIATANTDQAGVRDLVIEFKDKLNNL